MILYYPDPEETADNIRRFIRHVDKLILWDNTPEHDRAAYRVTVPEHEHKIIRRSRGRNQGIAYPLNRCAKWARDNGYTHLLSMDQDSSWEHFDRFTDRAEALSAVYRDAIMVPCIRHHREITHPAEYIGSFIISGTLYPLDMLKRVGGFNEHLFVDGVDFDLALRFRLEEVRTVCLKAGCLIQRFGNPIRSRYLHFTTPNYPPDRTYNIVRNHLLIFRRYRKILTSSEKTMILRGYIVGRLMKVILHEKNKASKCGAILRGCRDGMKKPLPAVFESWNTSL